MIFQADTLSTLVAVVGIGGPVVTAFGAVFAVKHSLNGTREDVREIKKTVGKISDKIEDHGSILRSTCDRLEDTRGWVGNIEGKMDRHIEMDT